MRAEERFRFLGQLTNLESKLAQDTARHCRDDIEALKVEVVKRAG